MAYSGRVGSDHGDGGDSGALARLCAGLKLYRAQAAAQVDAVSCWGGGGAVVVMEKRLGQPVTGNGDGCERRRRSQKCENGGAGRSGR